MAENIRSLIDSNQPPKSSHSLPKSHQASTRFTKIETPYDSTADYLKTPDKTTPPASLNQSRQTTPNPYGEIDEYLKEWAPKKPLPKPDTRIRMKKKTVNPLDFKEIDDFIAEWGPQTHGRPRTPPPLPPTPPSPKKSTLGCPQAIMQWYLRQKIMWVKILLVFGAVGILFGLGGLIYCAKTDCWGSGDGGVETTDIVRISMKNTMAKLITTNIIKIFKSTVSMQPKTVIQVVTGGGATEDTETTEGSDATKATENTDGLEIPVKPGVTGATTSSVGAIKFFLVYAIIIAIVVALIGIYNIRKRAIIRTAPRR